MLTHFGIGALIGLCVDRVALNPLPKQCDPVICIGTAVVLSAYCYFLRVHFQAKRQLASRRRSIPERDQSAESFGDVDRCFIL